MLKGTFGGMLSPSHILFMKLPAKTAVKYKFAAENYCNKDFFGCEKMRLAANLTERAFGV